MIKFLKTAIATAVVVFAGAASAAPTVFDFTSLTPFSGGAAGTGAGALGCGFNSGNDICGTSMTFAQGALTATATATYLGSSMNGTKSVRVVQDWNGTQAARYVGLGVYHKINDTSDDNLTIGEMLTLTFSQTVTLTGLNFRAEGHGLYNDLDDTFMFNGSSKLLAPSISGMSVTGKTFTFGFGGVDADQYYLSGMTVTAVPEPETYAMMLAGLGLMGAIVRRRKAKIA